VDVAKPVAVEEVTDREELGHPGQPLAGRPNATRCALPFVLLRKVGDELLTGRQSDTILA
jgi:hypothetical protein